eukprot:scaffold4099_cov403-Prasinococcus_capsulatus_cf.AAC.5
MVQAELSPRRTTLIHAWMIWSIKYEKTDPALHAMVCPCLTPVDLSCVQIMNTLGKHMSNAEVWGGSKDVLDAQSVLLTKELRERLEFDLTMLKNAAYTSGFRAAVDMKTS